jgi:hypothetical protein
MNGSSVAHTWDGSASMPPTMSVAAARSYALYEPSATLLKGAWYLAEFGVFLSFMVHFCYILSH